MQTIKEFDEFFHAHFDNALRMAAKILPIQEAEDVLQTCFLLLWQNRKSISNYKSYFFTAVRNKSLDVLKHNAFAVPMPPEEDLELNAPNELISKENIQALSKALVKLKPMHKRILELVLDGYSNKEIAALLVVTEQTIKNNKVLAIAELKNLIKNHNIEL